MKRRSWPWVIAVLSVVLISSSLFLPTEDWPWFAITAFTVWIGVTSSIGSLIASRRPDNPVGVLLVAMAFFVALGLLTTRYAAYALEEHPGSLPMGLAAAWLQTWLFVPVAGLLMLLALLFPTGRVPSPRWRWVARMGLGASIGLAASQAFRPGPLDALPTIRNPVGIAGVRPISDAVAAVSFLALAVSVIAALVSVFLRLRRARRDERQQVKWFTYAVGVLVCSVLVGPMLDTIGVAAEFSASPLGFFVPFLGLLAVPVSIGTAILRYRLYDIDRIVSRTLGYALITGVLVGAYVVLVVVLQTLTSPITRGSDLAIALSTLVVAAVFRPIRRRVQGTIDRRFNRTRYDISTAIEVFGARLRDQVDIDTLTIDLETLVYTAMEPAHVSLWVRGER